MPGVSCSLAPLPWPFHPASHPSTPPPLCLVSPDFQSNKIDLYLKSEPPTGVLFLPNIEHIALKDMTMTPSYRSLLKRVSLYYYYCISFCSSPPPPPPHKEFRSFVDLSGTVAHDNLQYFIQRINSQNKQP